MKGNLRLWLALALGVALGGVGMAILIRGERGDVEKTVARVSKSIVKIESFDAAGNSNGFGTGFSIGPGLIATVHHVVDEGDSLAVFDSDGNRYAARTLEAADAEGDVAIIGAEGCDLPALKIEKRMDKRVGPGLSVVVVGHPHGHDGTVTEGVVSAIRTKSVATVDYDEIQISAAISPGSSGSPIVSLKSGKVIGIATRTERGELINFAASAKTLLDCQEQSRLLYLPNWANPGYLELMSDPVSKSLVTSFNAENDYEKSLEIAKKFLTLYPDNYEAQRAIGGVLITLGKAEQALPNLRTAAEVYPMIGRHWDKYSLALHALGRDQEALEAATKLVALWPFARQCHRIYIAMLWHNGEEDRAREHLKFSNEAFEKEETMESVLAKVK